MTVTIVDNLKGDWRRVYVDREVVHEGDPRRLSLQVVLRAIEDRIRRTPLAAGEFKVAVKLVDDFSLLEEAGGVARS